MPEPVLGVSQKQDPDSMPQPASGISEILEKPAGHAFISYVREDAYYVDRLQRILEAAGISVWRDTADLWPGEDWRLKIRRAITDNAFVFIACFSSHSAARIRSYQNEELLLAVEQLRQRRPDVPWLIPVRFDDCLVSDFDLGGGRTLASIQRVDLFGEHREVGVTRLVTTVQRLLGQRSPDQDPKKTINPIYKVPARHVSTQEQPAAATDLILRRKVVQDGMDAPPECGRSGNSPGALIR